MSSYVYSMKNYHAVAKAEINLNGITVLAGLNGTGKSTLSRWLYYIVSALKVFDEFAYQEYIEKLQTAISVYDRILLTRRGQMYDSFFQNVRVEIRQMTLDRDGADAPYFKFGTAVSHLSDILHEAFESDSLTASQKERIQMSLQGFNNRKEVFSIDDYILEQYQMASEARKIMQIKSEKRNLSDAREYMGRYFRINEEFPSSIQLSEYGVHLWGKELGALMNLDNVLYIDTPLVCNEQMPEMYHWQDVRSQMMEDKGYAMSPQERAIAFRIKQYIRGDVYVRQSDMLRDRMRYKSADGSLDIPIQQTATGFKSFAYLLRLLVNGKLNERTLIIIDEPEAHLHPQWIVEYARVLVLLNKELGVKIVVSSHNPDMIAALHAIGAKKGLENEITFYLAEPSETDRNKFEYSPQGFEIGRIFESFNVALERIDLYESNKN